MVKIGYALSSEQFGPHSLLDQARRAEQAGFQALSISDHFHPWTDAQGQSPFVWSVVGALSQVTPTLPVSTFVTCPIIRIHPVIVAQAAATSAVMHGGRFILGVGSGENLNEHVWGASWPPARQRLAMLREAIELMRRLWTGALVNFEGKYFRAVNARIYTRPDRPPPVFVSAFGEKASQLAAEIGDGLVTMDPSLVKTFRDSGGRDKHIQSSVKACFDADEDKAVQIALELWGVDLLPGQLNQELAVPKMFEDAAQLVNADKVAEMFPCGPDPERHIGAIKKLADAGFDEVYVQQIGPDFDGFFDLYAKTVVPQFARS